NASALTIVSTLHETSYDSKEMGLCPGGERFCEQPLANVEERLFNIEDSAFQAQWGVHSMELQPINPELFDDIYANSAGFVGEQTTNSNGEAVFSVASVSTYIIIAEYIWTDPTGASWTLYKGRYVTPSKFRDTNRDREKDTASVVMAIAKDSKSKSGVNSIEVGSRNTQVLTDSPIGPTGAFISTLGTGNVFIAAVIILGILAIIILLAPRKAKGKIRGRKRG
ncbi:unnamed protein product, partial [marine sediment metagenome]